MQDATATPVSIRGLGKRYGNGRWALSDVNVDIPPGSTLCVLGPSGCGKSTLLRLVAGLDVPDAGEIRVGDRTLSVAGHATPAERRDVNMVFQDYALWPHLPVEEIIGYGLRHGRHRRSAEERRERVAELVEFLQLGGLERRRPAELSGGQQQRVAIARALATRPRLLLFDEPLSNLDAQLRATMREELAALLARLGTTALYVTHDVSEALALADHILVLHDGRVIQADSPSGVFSRPRSGWVAGLAGFSSVLELERAVVAGGEAIARFGETTIVGRDCGADAFDDDGRPRAYVHPDAVRLGGSVSGTVVSSVFEGRQHRLRLQLGDAGSVLVGSAEPMDLGATVGVTIDPSGVLVFGGTAREADLLGSPREPATESPTADEQHRDALHR